MGDNRISSIDEEVLKNEKVVIRDELSRYDYHDLLEAAILKITNESILERNLKLPSPVTESLTNSEDYLVQVRNLVIHEVRGIVKRIIDNSRETSDE